MSNEKLKLCILPMPKIKLIMKKYSGVGNVSDEATFVMTKAAEGFVALLLRQTIKASDDKKQVDYSDLAEVVSNDNSFPFLTDFISPKIKGSQYFDILKKVEEDERRIELEAEL